MTSGIHTTLNRRYYFSASHRLHSRSLSVAVNQRVFGKCNNPYGHGHDYVLDVSIKGKLDPTNGLIVTVSDLDKLVHAEVLAPMSHRNLNIDVREFSDLVPTTENLAIVIASRLTAQWRNYFPYSSAWLDSISIQETERNRVEVIVRKPAFQSDVLQVNESVIMNA